MRVIRGALTTLRREGRTLSKLGLYAVVCLVVLAWLISVIGNVAFFADRTGYTAELDDATGLLANDEVRIAGVPVGKVSKVSVERGRAIVDFDVDDSVELTTAAQAGVRWRNVLGQKYLYVYPGDGGDPLEPGDRLPITQAVSSSDVGDFLNAVGPVLLAIDPQEANLFVRALVEGLQGNEARVRSLLTNAAAVVETVGSLDTEVGSTITNLDSLVTAIAQRDDDLDTVLTRLASVSGQLAEGNDVLQELVLQFATVQEQLVALLSENRGDLDSIIDALDEVSGTLAGQRDNLERSLDTLPEGLIPYHTISAYGEWFQIRATVVCLANQTVCSPESLTTDLAGGAGFADPPAAGSLLDVLLFPAGGGQ